jgi:hypothetical protein
LPNDSEEVKCILSHLIAKVEEILVEKPFFFVNEHDVAAFLYSKLTIMPEFQLPRFLERDGKRQAYYRVHMEYPRHLIKDERLRYIGKYDVAILRKDNTIEEPFRAREDEFTKKPVWVGFEVKLHWDVGIRRVKSGFESEKNAFAKEVNHIERRPADYGVVFHLNIGKKIMSKKNVIFDYIKKFQKLKGLQDSRIFVVYIESFREKEEPKIIALDNDGKEFR